MTAKILVSACLLGRPVRYDGSAMSLVHDVLHKWQAEGRLIPICPELAAGLAVPRPPAELADRVSGEDVLSGRGRVIEIDGADVTSTYISGAEAALALAQVHDCRFALLTDGSPSCGSTLIHDGAFTGTKHDGMGVTTALLRSYGIAVYSERNIDGLIKLIG
jgi:uncharacterized protein YbbK (DUF523 family)